MALLPSIVPHVVGLPIKHYASLVGLILVGTLAMFFCFLPDLIKENHLTLREGTWIALFLTLGSFGCFWIEKQETAKEEREREMGVLHVFSSQIRIGPSNL
jgi:hypothetical protein